MNHYLDFNPYQIRERNQQIHTEVNSLRLQEQLRHNRKVRSCSRLFALVKRGMLIVGKARLAQQHTSRCHDRAPLFAGTQTPNHRPVELPPRKPGR
jgi:hypothetical protein